MTASLVLIFASLGQLTIGEVKLEADGFQFTEGPVWLSSGGLAFSDIPSESIFMLDKRLLHKVLGGSNGLSLDPEGRLVRCEHGNRRIARVEKDGTVTTLADAYQGKKLNSPNDAVMRSDGVLYFTDPTYGLGDRPKEVEFNGVYWRSVDGEMHVVAKDFNMPNGIAFSPDENTLYVADTAESHIRAFAVAKDGSASGGMVLCPVPTPDGIRVDLDGNIWSSSSEGIVVFDSKGSKLQTIAFPQVPANCGFGGPDGKTLYVTARTAVYSIKTNVAGLPRPVAKK